MTMMTMDQANAYAAGRNFENLAHLKGTTYKDVSTVVILPSRGMMHQRAAQAIFNVQGPMNAKRAVLTCEGHEVGHAYNAMIDTILAHPDLGKWRYVLTIEDDNLPPPDAHLRLIESIETGPFDAVGALYFTKGEGGMPMCYGDPSQLAPRPRCCRAWAHRGVQRDRDGLHAVSHGLVPRHQGAVVRHHSGQRAWAHDAGPVLLPACSSRWQTVRCGLPGQGGPPGYQYRHCVVIGG